MNPEGTLGLGQGSSSRAEDLEAELDLLPDTKLNLTTEDDSESHIPPPDIILLIFLI